MKLERQRRFQEEEKLGVPPFSVASECLEARRHPVSISPKVERERHAHLLSSMKWLKVSPLGLCFRIQAQDVLSP